MTIHITKPYSTWGHVGVAGAVVEEPGEKTYVQIHDMDGNEIEVAPIRFEVSWSTAEVEAGGWSPSSITIVGVRKGARTVGETVACQYSGPVDVSRALARLPELFRKYVDEHSPARLTNR
jgi:hypothetical protein